MISVCFLMFFSTNLTKGNNFSDFLFASLCFSTNFTKGHNFNDFLFASLYFSANLTKGNNFSDFMFASLMFLCQFTKEKPLYRLPVCFLAEWSLLINFALESFLRSFSSFH